MSSIDADSVFRAVSRSKKDNLFTSSSENLPSPKPPEKPLKLTVSPHVSSHYRFRSSDAICTCRHSRPQRSRWNQQSEISRGSSSERRPLRTASRRYPQVLVELVVKVYLSRKMERDRTTFSFGSQSTHSKFHLSVSILS